MPKQTHTRFSLVLGLDKVTIQWRTSYCSRYVHHTPLSLEAKQAANTDTPRKWETQTCLKRLKLSISKNPTAGNFLKARMLHRQDWGQGHFLAPKMAHVPLRATLSPPTHKRLFTTSGHCLVFQGRIYFCRQDIIILGYLWTCRLNNPATNTIALDLPRNWTQTPWKTCPPKGFRHSELVPLQRLKETFL